MHEREYEKRIDWDTFGLYILKPDDKRQCGSSMSAPLLHVCELLDETYVRHTYGHISVVIMAKNMSDAKHARKKGHVCDSTQARATIITRLANTASNNFITTFRECHTYMQDHFIIEKNYGNVHYQNMFRQLYNLVADKLKFPNDYNWIQEGDNILKSIQQYLITYDQG